IPAGCIEVLAAADLNGDGLGDFVTTCRQGISRGDGTFEVVTQNYGQIPFLVADFNADGPEDLAFQVPGGLAIHAGLGDGRFQPPRLFGPLPGATYFPGSGIMARDLDGDGHTDLVAQGMGSPSLLVVWGRATGFSGTPLVEYAGIGPVKTLAIGDLEGDGLPDSLVAPADTPKIRTFLHPGTAGGQNGPTIDSGGAYSVLEAADLDGEGWPDLVGTKYATAGVALVTLLGEKGRVKSHAAMPAGDLPAAVAVGRIDG